MGQGGYTATNRARKIKGMNEKGTCSVFEDVLYLFIKLLWNLKIY